jgi:Thaumatin family
MSSAQVRGQDCGGKCEQTSGCTHYTWTTFNGGTCWMKSGRVSKSDAFDTGDQSMICGVTGSSPGPDPGPGPKPSEVEFRVINRCPFTIWPGIQGRKRSDPNWRLPFNGGWELGAGQTSTFGIPKDFNAGRIWARTNCRSAGNQFPCETGFCGFKQCAFDGVQRGGQTPASLAEFTLSANGQDYYDVSLVDGYNLKISIIVRKPNSDQ